MCIRDSGKDVPQYIATTSNEQDTSEYVLILWVDTQARRLQNYKLYGLLHYRHNVLTKTQKRRVHSSYAYTGTCIHSFVVKTKSYLIYTDERFFCSGNECTHCFTFFWPISFSESIRFLFPFFISTGLYMFSISLLFRLHFFLRCIRLSFYSNTIFYILNFQIRILIILSKYNIASSTYLLVYSVCIHKICWKPEKFH